MGRQATGRGPGRPLAQPADAAPARGHVSEARRREFLLDPDDPQHGTTAGYEYGCRLDCCRRARADYVRVYNERRRSS